jgi:hypothetical protein
MDDFIEKREYGELKEETLDRTLWSTWFGKNYQHFVRQIIDDESCHAIFPLSMLVYFYL